MNRGELAELAEKLRGFPNTPLDTRDFLLGAFGPESAGGGVGMRFHCIDGPGHAYAEAKIESSGDSVGTSQSVILSLPIEASAVESFIAALSGLQKTFAGVAFLKGTIHSGRVADL
jgi:hypothetical protein